MKIILSLSILILTLLTASVKAGTADSVPFARNEILSFNYYSDILQRKYAIDVLLPLQYDSDDQQTHYPVVFMIDGYPDFPMMASNFFKQIATEKIPPFIFVGIDHKDQDNSSAQTHDYTPTAAMFQGSIQGGGADEFLNFLNNELKPFINTTFRGNTQDQTFMGYSVGGLFALHVLFTQPESFQRYVVASPSIWWDDKVVLKQERQYAANNSDLAKKVHMFAGQEETGIASDMRKLYRLLQSRHYPNLHLSKKVYSDENHLTVSAPGYNQGIRRVF